MDGWATEEYSYYKKGMFLSSKRNAPFLHLKYQFITLMQKTLTYNYIVQIILNTLYVNSFMLNEY